MCAVVAVGGEAAGVLLQRLAVTGRVHVHERDGKRALAVRMDGEDGHRPVCSRDLDLLLHLHLVVLVLGQAVGDLEPGRLRANEDVLGRTDARLVLERA